MTPSLSTRLQLGVKRGADVLVSALLLAALAPALALIAAWVKATSPGEAIFKQKRVGKGGRVFTIYKFRTMVKDAPSSPLGTYCYQDDPRITSAGKVLRKTSLDELPQLLNVLKGDMSFVGPRPDLPHHVERYSERQRRRLDMRPGITGWAQVNGRNQIPWNERIEMDLEYVEGWSLLRDAGIAFRTVAVVLTGKGAEAPKALKGRAWDKDKDKETEDRPSS
jgi:lipopolysaccharide/colanic/teichoic acid biosynthesis glycosyltransferase